MISAQEVMNIFPMIDSVEHLLIRAGAFRTTLKAVPNKASPLKDSTVEKLVAVDPGFDVAQMSIKEGWLAVLSAKAPIGSKETMLRAI